MIINKKLFLVMALIILLLGLGVASATNDTSDNGIASTSTGHVEKTSATKNVETNAISKDKTNNKNISKKDVTTSNKKQEAKTIILNNQTFDDYLNVTATQGSVVHHYFNDEVNDGDIIDVQGKITDRNAFHITVNKKLHFITSTNDGEFDFGGAGQIIFNKYSSGSSVEGLTFRNCQFTTTNASDITINNISTLNIGQAIGNGIGSVSIRDGSQNITVTNSYFLTQNNGGHSNFVYAVAYNCLLENNTMESIGTSGNIFYITTYNVFEPVPIMNSVNLTIRNNTIRGTNTPSTGICIGMALSGFGHTIENNLIVKKDYIMGIQWSDPGYEGEGQIDETQTGEIIFRNNTVYGNDSAGLGIHGIVSDNMFYCAASISGPKVYNNTFQSVKLGSDVIFENNTLKADLNPFYNNTVSLNIEGNNTTVKNVDGTIHNMSVIGSNNTIKDLTVDTKNPIKVNGINNIITNNNIRSTQRFAIEVTGENNAIINNTIEAESLKGNVAVKYTQGTGVIENNTPETGAQNIFITEDNYSDYFDDKGNMIIKVPEGSVITFTGNFTNKDFILDNINGVIVPDKFIIRNSTFTFGKNNTIILDDSFVINNTISDKKTALIIESDNTKFEKMDVYVDGTASDIVAVKVTGNNNNIESYVRVYEGTANQENPGGIGFLIESANNTIINRFVKRFADVNYVTTVLTETSYNNTIREAQNAIISGNNNKISGTSATTQIGSPVILNNANFTRVSMSAQSTDYPAILINNSNNNIIENSHAVSTGLEYAIYVVNNSNNNIICNNTIRNNQTYGGDNAVYIDETSLNNSVFKNSLTLVKLNDETYSQLFTDGVWNDDYTAIQLIGDLHNKNLTFNNKINIDGNGYTIYNGTIMTKSGQVEIQNLIINNTNGNPGMLLNGQLSIINNTVFAIGDNISVVNLKSGSFINTLRGFVNNTVIGYGNNMVLFNMEFGVMTQQITGNNLTITGDNVTAVYFKTLQMQSKFNYNNVTVNAGKSSKVLFIPGSSSYEMLTNSEFNYNNIILNTDESSTLLDFIPMASQTKINYNNITINSNASSVGVVFENTNSVISPTFSYNNVIINSDNATTALKYLQSSTTTMPTITYNNFTVNTNQSTNLISFNGMITSGKIQYNQILVNTTQNSVAIISATSGSGSQITNNYIESLDLVGDNAIQVKSANLKSNTPTSTSTRKVVIDVEDVELEAGIINNIHINVTNMFEEAVEGTLTATIDGEEIPITDNVFVYTPDKAGRIDIKYTFTDTGDKYATTSVTKTYTVEVLPPQLSAENLTVTESTNITAYFYDENGNAANGGKAIFRVNGKSLRDDQGNVIYVDVVDGKAIIEDVTIDNEWMIPDTTIQAIYSGTDDFEPIFTEKTTVNVTKPEATIEITSPLTGTAGETITLTANVTDGDKLINSGRVVFKLNGKTLKNEYGKALYVNVENGVATTNYTLPSKTKAKTYTLTAVYTDTTYDRVEDTKDFFVTSA